MDIRELDALADATVKRLDEGREFPLVIVPARRMLDIVEWAAANKQGIDLLIGRAGALLFRGFDTTQLTTFESFADAVCDVDWVAYREAATPRTHVQGHVHTATEYPSDYRIYVHNENSHVTSWPLYLFFHCRKPASQGGNTPLADCRGVFRRLPQSVVSKFLEKGWRYQRNFGARSSIPWQKAFGTDQRAGVEQYCRENHMSAEWSGERLTVRYRRWAALRHPRTDDMIWFNHGMFFNPYTLEPRLKELMGSLGEAAMPYATYYGDGTPIDPETLRILDEAYAAETLSFPWQAGDILMVDNMRHAHGRQPYRGDRQVFVAMKWKVSCSDVAAPHEYAG